MNKWLDEHREMRAALRQFVTTEIEPRRFDLEFGDVPPYDVLRLFYKSFGLDQMAVERFEDAKNRIAPPPPGRRGAWGGVAPAGGDLAMLTRSRHLYGCVN